jgi:hypothetical protein
MDVDPAKDGVESADASPGHWRVGPPSHEAESSLRASEATVEDADNLYEGEEEESEEESRRADLFEEQDVLDYEESRQFEDDFDDSFWAELEAEVLHSADHGRT